MSSPLSWFRKNQKILLGVFGVLLMIAFTVSLGTGVDPIVDYLSGGRGGASQRRNEVVVSWDGGKLYESELQNFRYRRIRLAQFVRSVLAVSSGQPRVIPVPLTDAEESLLQTYVLSTRAKKMGLVVSDDAIREYLRGLSSSPLSQLSTILRQATRGQMSQDQLFEVLRDELLAQKMQVLAYSGLFPVSPVASWDFHNRLNRRINAELMAIKVSDFVDQVDDPSEEQLNAFFEEYKDRYAYPNSPEPGFKQRKRIAVQFVRADFNSFLEEELPKVTDQQISEYYEDNKDEFRASDAPEMSDIELETDEKPQEGPELFDLPKGGESPQTESGESSSGTADEAMVSDMPPLSTEPAAEEPVKDDTDESPAEKEPAEKTDSTVEPADQASSADAETGEVDTTESDNDTPLDTPSDQAAEAPATDGSTESEQEPPDGDEAADPKNEDGSESASEEEAIEEKQDSDETSASLFAVGPADEGDADESDSADVEKSNADHASDEPANDDQEATQPSSDAASDIDAQESGQVPNDSESMPDNSDATPDESVLETETADPSDLTVDGDLETDSSAEKQVDTPSLQSAQAQVDQKAPGESASGETDGDSGDSMTEDQGAEPRYKPLEDVKDEIRQSIARREAQKRLDVGLAETRRVVGLYFKKHIAWEFASKENPDAPKPTPPDFAAITDNYAGLTVGKTPLVDRFEVEQYEIGRAYDLTFAGGRVSRIGFTDVAFSEDIKAYQARQFPQTGFDVVFLYWETDEQEAFVPKLEEIRDQVIRVWKMQEGRAVKLATEAAGKDAKGARKSGKSLAETFADVPGRTFSETGQISWMTTGSLPMDSGTTPSLAVIPGVEGAGPEFRERMFRLRQGEIGVTVNQPRTHVYVVRVISEEPSQEQLQNDFLETGVTPPIRYVAARETRRSFDLWYDGLLRSLQLRWHREPLAANVDWQ